MIDPWLGFVTPLLVRSPTRFAPPAPPELTSARYTRDFNEVKALGSATSTVRTQARTDTALFYSRPGQRPVPGHFRFGDTAARDMGIRLADWTLDHYFQPLHGHGEAG
ncbi:MAG TPA: hypothetical protein VJ140_07470 [Actinomycetota bacterium]|nr:hypothetical protein [Actinomycetota bacterium]